MSDEIEASSIIVLTQDDVNQMVLSHDRDIRAVKAVIGFLVVVGGLILTAVTVFSDVLSHWFHK